MPPKYERYVLGKKYSEKIGFFCQVVANMTIIPLILNLLNALINISGF